MRWGIKLYPPGSVPQWLSEFDPNAHAPGRLYPTGDAAGTLDPEQALTFESAVEATEFVMQISEVCPTRPDGKPNRPLMAFTTSIEEVRPE